MSEREGGLLGALTKLFKKKPEVIVVGEAKPPMKSEIPPEAEHAKGGGQKPAKEAKKPSQPEVAPVAPPAAAAKPEAQTQQQALRDRLQEQAMARHTLKYDQLSLKAKLELLNEQLGEQPDPKAAALKAKLEELQKLNWEEPSPEQTTVIEQALGGMREIVPKGDPNRSVLVEVQSQVSQHVLNPENLRDYGLKPDDPRTTRMFGYPEVAGGAGPAAPDKEDIFNKKMPHADKDTALDADLQKQWKELQRNPLASREHEQMLAVADELVGALAENKISDLGAQNEAKTLIRNLRQQSLNAMLGEHRERYSRFYLLLKEEMKAQDNPERAIEEFLRQTELVFPFFPESGQAAEAQDRANLIAGYAGSLQYSEDLTQHLLMKGDVPENMRIKDHPLYKKYTSIEYIDKLSAKVSMRTGIQRAYGIIRATGSLENAAKSLMNVGEAGVHFVLNENGRLVDVAYNKYLAKFNEFRRELATGKRREISADDLRRLHQSVIEDMWEQVELYKPQYEEHWGKDSPPLTKNDISAIVRQAEMVAAVTQRDAVGMLFGLNPYEGDALDRFVVGTTAENLLAGWDVRWLFHKWNILTPGERVMWENSARAAAKAHHLEKYIDKRIKEARGNDLKMRRLIHEAFHIQGDGEQPDALKDRAGERLKFNKEARPYPGLRTYKDFVTRRGLGVLRDRLIVNAGEEHVARMLTIYDYFSSGVIGDVYVNQINTIWGEAGYAEHLGLGFRLRRAGDRVMASEFLDPHHEDLAVLKERLETVLRDVAKYRPHALLEFLADGMHEPTLEEFTKITALVQQAFPDVTIEPNRPDKLFAQIAKRFLIINDLLAQGGLPPIDYSTSLTTEQLALVNKVCKGFNRSTKDQPIQPRDLINAMDSDGTGYLTLMKKLSALAGQDAQIYELMTEPYYHIYRRNQWMDDARLALLEKPLEAKGGKFYKPPEERGKTKELISREELEGMPTPISERISFKGRGANSGVYRAWGDNNTGRNVVDNFRKALNPDEKALIENLKAIHEGIKMVYGWEPWAGRAPLYLIGGYGYTMKTDALADWIPIVSKEGRFSAVERVFGLGVDSMGLNELEHMIEKAAIPLGSDLKHIAPEIASEIEEWLGISRKFGHIETRLPLGLYRARLFLVLAAILLAYQSLKTAQEELGGGGGGSH